MTDPGYFPLPTDTAHVRIDSRQYRLFKVDLGEGIPRVALKVGAAVFPPWLLACYLIGVPLSGLVLWLAPPLLLTLLAMSRDAGGRLRLVSWGDRLSWLARRHRPIVNAGTASAAAPRPVAVPISFLVSDALELTRDQVVETLPDTVRGDFEESTGLPPFGQRRTTTQEDPRAQAV